MEQKKILIVEDSESIREMLKVMVESEGYEVITAEDGMEGLTRARSDGPDLIILDLMLPKMDGFKVCRMLKFDSQFRRIPILILTARSSDADRLMGEEVGADDYLVKPFEPETLLERIRYHLAEGSHPAP